MQQNPNCFSFCQRIICCVSIQDVYSFLPASNGDELNLGTTQVYGLSEASRDCDVSCQLMTVEISTPDDETSTVTAAESVYANTAPVYTLTC